MLPEIIRDSSGLIVLSGVSLALRFTVQLAVGPTTGEKNLPRTVYWAIFVECFSPIEEPWNYYKRLVCWIFRCFANLVCWYWPVASLAYGLTCILWLPLFMNLKYEIFPDSLGALLFANQNWLQKLCTCHLEFAITKAGWALTLIWDVMLCWVLQYYWTSMKKRLKCSESIMKILYM